MLLNLQTNSKIYPVGAKQKDAKEDISLMEVKITALSSENETGITQMPHGAEGDL